MINMAKKIQANVQSNSTQIDSTIFVDHSHCNRFVTGLERIALEQFSPEILTDLPIHLVRANSRLSMLWQQNLRLPFLLAKHPKSLLLCPGFPPALLTHPFRDRVIPYIHDVFPLTRSKELSLRARVYIGSLLRLALIKFPRLMVNSETTAGEIKPYCLQENEIILYRPEVRNIFQIDPHERDQRIFDRSEFRLLAIGTIEPRKNLLCAARILQILRERHFPHARLDIVGRIGWGEDHQLLASCPGVYIHGYQNTSEVRRFLNQAHAFINTSHSEGLGLPLLEAQHAGLMIIARDIPIFHEVLAASGLLFDDQKLIESSDRIAAAFAINDWLSDHRSRALHNIERWNALARHDRARLQSRLYSLLKERRQ